MFFDKLGRLLVSSAVKAKGSAVGDTDLVVIDGSADGVVVPASASLLVAAAGARFNGSGWDREYNNVAGTLLANAARTANTSSPVQTNFNARGVAIWLNVTAASGTGGVSLSPEVIDPVSGTVKGLLPSQSPQTTTGCSWVIVYPGLLNQYGGLTCNVYSLALPRDWQLTVSHGDATSYTYSVGYSYIV
ncbi:MAG TPA: hypothetical protein VFZ25_18945 [Chloroflexota bacterium]|nr:hypothetical protein [Chloroflexota bacterium]